MCREAEALAKEVVWREARGTSAGARSQTIDIEQNVDLAMGCVAFRRCEGLKSLGSSVAPCSQDGGMEGEDRGDDGARHDDLRHRGRGAQNPAGNASSASQTPYRRCSAKCCFALIGGGLCAGWVSLEGGLCPDAPQKAHSVCCLRRTP